MEYFFDSYAIIEIINGKGSYSGFKDTTVITTVMNLAEVYYALLRSNGKEEANKIIKTIDPTFIKITKEIVIKSSNFRFKNKKLKMSYVDCIGYTLSLKNNLKFLTGDEAFKDLKNVEFIK